MPQLPYFRKSVVHVYRKEQFGSKCSKASIQADLRVLNAIQDLPDRNASDTSSELSHEN